jgi:hypothetical protein
MKRPASLTQVAPRELAATCEERKERMTTAADARVVGRPRERYAPLTGAVAVVLWVLGIIIGESATDDGSPTTLLNSYRHDEGQILLGGFLWLLGTFFFFWFLGSLRTRLLAVDGGSGRLSSVAFGGGLAAAIFGLALPGPDMSAAIADGADLSTQAATALNVMGDVFFIGAEMSAAVLLAAVGLLALRGAFPRWVGWLSLLIALVLIVLPIGWAGLIFAFPLWTLLMTYLLWKSPTADSSASAASRV